MEKRVALRPWKTLRVSEFPRHDIEEFLNTSRHPRPSDRNGKRSGKEIEIEKSPIICHPYSESRSGPGTCRIPSFRTMASGHSRIRRLGSRSTSSEPLHDYGPEDKAWRFSPLFFGAAFGARRQPWVRRPTDGFSPLFIGAAFGAVPETTDNKEESGTPKHLFNENIESVQKALCFAKNCRHLSRPTIPICPLPALDGLGARHSSRPSPPSSASSAWRSRSRSPRRASIAERIAAYPDRER